MIEARGITFAELDARASEPQKPFAAITADCSGAHEFDDAIAVTPLPAATETYRVDIFAVDTSRLYFDEEIVRRAMLLTESRYGTPSDYRPMLDRDLTQSLHFAQGTTRNALAISFIVGVADPPTDVSIGFGRVEVTRNWKYDEFGTKCRYSPNWEHYGRAAAILMSHLDIDPGTTEEIKPELEDIYKNVIHVPKSETWKRGASINQTFMIAGNYLVGKAASDNDDLLIYRAHDSTQDHLLDVLSPSVARYTTVPTPHHGLGLDLYTRVTSPLRRLEDFINLGLIKLRDRGRVESPRDTKITQASIQRLNQRVAAEQFAGPLMVGRYDQKPSPRPVIKRAEALSRIA